MSKKEQQTIFNIYYINLAKVYEIRMMLDNKILSSQSLEKERKIEGSGKAGADFGLDFLDFLKLGSFNTEGKIEGGGSRKVLETFEIKTTKSIILREVIKKSENIENIKNLKEGKLIKLNGVKLDLVNENELRLIKFMNSGAFKDFMPQETKGFDLNNIFNSMFKDYAYKIKGTKVGLEKDLLIKIPLSFESEFESSYSVDDLFIGKVSIIGLYKGEIEIGRLKNSFEYFKEIGDLQNSFNQNQKTDEEIQDSYYTDSSTSLSFDGIADNSKYHYIDLLAIIQNIETFK